MRTKLLATLASFLIGGAVAVPANAANFGASPSPASITSLHSLEQQVGRPMDSARRFFRWDNQFPTTYDNALKNEGKTLIVSVQAIRNNARMSWRAIANAQPGSPLHNDMVRWAQRLRNFGAPLYFSFNHEAEVAENMGSGTAPEFIAAWRKFIGIVRAQGATNVSFMWIATSYSYMVNSGDRRFAGKWYPGDAYVDVIASDAYNWGNCRDNVPSQWRSLAYIIEGHRKFGLLHPDKPLWLAEWGSTEDRNDPTRKAAWFREALATLKSPAYSQFIGVTYFNVPGVDRCVWDVRSSPASLEAFSEIGRDPYFMQ